MKTSDQTQELIAALIAAKAKFTPLKKSRTATVRMKKGGYYSYNYADLADILNMVTPALAAFGLVIIQPFTIADGQILIFTELMHTSGQWLSTELPLPNIATGNMNAIQQIGSVTTYGRRYAIEALLGIASEDDTDGRGGEDSKGKAEAERKADEEADQEAGPTKKAAAEKNRKTENPVTPKQEREKILAKITQLMKHTRFIEGHRIKAKADIATAKTNIELEAVRVFWQAKFDELAEETAQQKNGAPKDLARQKIVDEIGVILNNDKFNKDDRIKVRVEISVTGSNIGLEALRAVWQGKLNRLKEDFKDDDPEEAAKPNTGKKLTDEEKAAKEAANAKGLDHEVMY